MEIPAIVHCSVKEEEGLLGSAQKEKGNGREPSTLKVVAIQLVLLANPKAFR